ARVLVHLGIREELVLEDVAEEERLAEARLRIEGHARESTVHPRMSARRKAWRRRTRRRLRACPCAGRATSSAGRRAAPPSRTGPAARTGRGPPGPARRGPGSPRPAWSPFRRAGGSWPRALPTAERSGSAGWSPLPE